MEITTADKLHATLQVFAKPDIYITMGVLLVLMFAYARAKETAHKIPTMAGRFGLVVHWGSLIIAVALLAAAGLVLANTQPMSEANVIPASLLAIAALVIWLLGKAARFVLTGPAESPPKTDAAPSSRRTTSVPIVTPPTRAAPWGPSVRE